MNNKELFEASVYGKTGPENKEKLEWLFCPTPLSVEEDKKYFTICLDNEYRFWSDIFELIGVPLNNAGFSGITISRNGGKGIKFYRALDQIRMRHAAYVIKNAQFHIGSKDWSLDLAENNDEDFVNIYGLSVEDAAKAILEKAGVSAPVKVRTQFVGENYGEQFLQLIPNFKLPASVSHWPKTPIEIRCDLFEEWNFVVDAISKGIRPFVTTKSVPPKCIHPILKAAKKLNIIVNDNTCPKLLRNIEEAGIPYTLFNVDDKNIGKIKNKLFDFKDIIPHTHPSEKELDILKSLPYDTKVRSMRKLVSKEGEFASVYHWKTGVLLNDKLKGNLLMDAVEDKQFLNEYDLFLYYKTVNE